MFHVKQEIKEEPQEYTIGTSDQYNIYIKQEEIEPLEYIETSNELKIHNKQKDIKEEIEPQEYTIGTSDEYKIYIKQEYIKEEIEPLEYIETSDELNIYNQQKNIKEEIDPLKEIETSAEFDINYKQEPQSAKFSPRARSNKKLLCTVKGCNSISNEDLELCFHYFPMKTNFFVYIKNMFGKSEKTSKLEAWMKAVGIKEVNSGMKICSRHFKVDDYILPNVPAKVRRLKNIAVPSLNLPNSTNGRAEHDRKVRVLNRNIKKTNPTKKFHQVEPMNSDQSVVYQGNLEVKEEIQTDTDIQNKQNDLNEETYSDKYLTSVNCELRTTDQSDNLERHICSVCTKEFKGKSNLTQHMLVHTGQRPFKCNQCNYSCTQKSYLNSHKITHSNEQPFKCEQCEYSCKRRMHLNSHILTHSNTRPFKCEQCEYSCTHKSNLNKHKLIHSNTRPFKCEQCEYSCREKGSLNSHKLTHSNKRPFKCDQCEYSGARKSNLKTHKLIHSDKRPFKCDKCEYGFTQQSYLNRHKVTHFKNATNVNTVEPR